VIQVIVPSAVDEAQMTEGEVNRRRAQSGQAAVESAIATPMTMFVVLGLIQIGMIQQARFFVDYAAYRGVKACSVGRCVCKNGGGVSGTTAGSVLQSELAALVPILGRADDSTHWISTWDRIKDNRNHGLPIVQTSWTIENQVFPFDTPLAPTANPEKVRLKIQAYVEMNVPFVNWLFARYYLAEFGLVNLAQDVDPIEPIGHEANPPTLGSATIQAILVKNYFNRGVFVAPIYSSWSMRMFSQGNASTLCE
jgi:hypothetical protein